MPAPSMPFPQGDAHNCHTTVLFLVLHGGMAHVHLKGGREGASSSVETWQGSHFNGKSAV